MADPRAVIDFSEIDAEYATYKIDNSTIVYDSTKARGAATTMLDKAVSLSGDGTVQLASDGEGIVGRIDEVKWDNTARIQFEGYMQLPGGNGASLTRGKKIVGALGAASAKGYIREVATGTAAELGVAVGAIQDASDTTNVWVLK